jgi:4-aminobutyrate aminotransferase-like enzyme
LGDWLLEQLRAMAVRHPSIAEVRGLGLMVGIACRAPAGGDGSAESAGVVAAQVERLCLSAGVLVLHSGPSGEVVRLLPPLTVEQADLARAVDILDQAFAAAERNPMQEPR